MQYKRCTYRVSAKALIVDNNKILLVKEDSPFWDLPGGGVEHFEDPVNALRREIDEELRAEATSVDEKSLKAWATYDVEHERPLLFLVYRCKVSHFPEESTNGIQIGYFTRNELASLEIEPHLHKFRGELIATLV